MSKDILNEYGRDTPQKQAPVATSGGCTTAKEMPYSPPIGPKGIGDAKSPGLHGTNHGCCGTQSGSKGY